MSEIELKKQKAFKLIQEVDDENIIEEVVKFLQEKKHTLTAEQIFSEVSSKYDNTLNNLVNEPEAIYQTQQMEDFEVPQEWIDEADEAGRRMDSGEDKGYTLEETMKMAHEHLEMFRKNRK